MTLEGPVLQSKGYKDRVVWITPDIAEMLGNTMNISCQNAPVNPLCFLVLKDGKPINEVTVRAYFSGTLAMTSYASA